MNKTPAIVFLIIGLLLILPGCKKEDASEPYPVPDYFEVIWSDFDRTYPYFLHKNIDWDSVHELYSASISEDISEQKLFELIGEMTLMLKDIHVYLSSPYGYIHYSKKDNYPENPPDNAINYLEEVSLDNTQGVFGRIAGTNYAYIRIKTFNGYESDYSQLYTRLNTILDKDGLIMDIRSNGGGRELNGRYLAGRFAPTDTPYTLCRERNGPNWDDFTPWHQNVLPRKGYLNFNKPVILLTNRSVYSSAELFVLMMKTYPNLVIVGDTTGAASANPVYRNLYGGWQYKVSTWQSADMDTVLIEDNGIPPDHYILMTDNSISEGKDLILEKAIELLDSQ